MEAAKASLPDSVTPQELAFVLDCLGASTVPKSFGETYALAQVVRKLVALTNQPHPVGAIVPQPDYSKDVFKEQFPLVDPMADFDAPPLPVIELAP